MTNLKKEIAKYLKQNKIDDIESIDYLTEIYQDVMEENMEKKIKTKKIILKNDTIISSRVELTKNVSNVNISINSQ
jgi:uncharacterized lipoprotein YajG